MHVTALNHSYPVVVTRVAAPVVAEVVAGRRAFVVTTPSAAGHVAALTADLAARPPVRVVADGEAAKTLDSVEQILAWFADQQVTPADVVIAVGGGALTDLAGFAAGVWRRGVPWVVAPTTVACAVDAGIGGKTAVNTAAGKNTAGRLWNPDAVVCDPGCFATLPPAVVADGLAEVVKVGCSHDPGLLDAIAASSGAAPGEWVDQVVANAARVAVDVASGTYGPGDNPDVLSLGHEIAHALEALSGFSVGHGAAVAVGLRFSQHLRPAHTYRVSPDRLDRVLEHCGLPLTAAAAGLDVAWPAVRAELNHDKRMAGRLRFLVALRAGTVWSDDVDEATAEYLWESALRGETAPPAADS